MSSPRPRSAKAEEEDDGWVHVRPKSRRRAANRRQPDAAAGGKLAKFSQRSPRADEERQRAPEDIAAEYRRIRSRWEDDAACGELRRLAEQATVGPVSRAVCLGIGTFDPPDGGWETKRRTFLQLIAFLILVETLEKVASSTIECVFQDPVFSASDRQFIESLGHRVVETPQGFELVHGETALYGVHLYRPIYAQAVKGSLPAIFVGTDLDVWDWVALGQVNDEFASSKNFKIMGNTYRKSAFPDDDSTAAFSSTSFYWRPPNQEPASAAPCKGSARTARDGSPRDDLGDDDG